MNNTLKKSVIAGALALGLGGCAQTAKIPVVGGLFENGAVAMQKVFNERSALTFKAGSAGIDRAAAAAELEPFVSRLAELPRGGRLIVEGHTDNLGRESDNLQLSYARAEAVAGILESLGVGSSQIEATGHGSKKPAGNNETRAGRALNRRVEVTLIRL